LAFAKLPALPGRLSAITKLDVAVREIQRPAIRQAVLDLCVGIELRQPGFDEAKGLVRSSDNCHYPADP